MPLLSLLRRLFGNSDQAADFHREMDAYVAETNALLRANRPLSERKLRPPTSSPYEGTVSATPFLKSFWFRVIVTVLLSPVLIFLFVWLLTIAQTPG